MSQPAAPPADPTEAALRRAVCVTPHDDLPRLALADHLDDLGGPGNAAYAEFVRVQCELAKLESAELNPAAAYSPDCGCEVCRLVRLREREYALWNAGKEFRGQDPWFGPLPGTIVKRQHHHEADGYAVRFNVADGDRVTVIVRRGFVETVECRLDTLLGGPCGRCRGFGQESSVSPEGGREYDGPTCRACSGPGRTAGVAAALFAAHPVVSVRPTDLRATPFVDGEGFDAAALPAGVVPHLRPESVHDWPDGRRILSWSSRRGAADDALSLAVVNLGRSRAAGHTHEVECGRCKGNGSFIPRAAGFRPGDRVECPDCSGTGRVTRPGLPPLEVPRG